MALSPNDLKKGAIFSLDNEPYQSLDYKQKVMGRGSSVVTVKAKNLRSGKLIEKTFRGSENLAEADVSTQTVQYLYTDGSNYYFMDPDTFEQIELSSELIGNLSGYLVEGQKTIVQFFDGNPINIELPKNVWLKVEYTEPAVKGDTTSNVMKDAKLETGMEIKVPIFINTGDTISVDVETGAYRERQK